MTPPRVPRLLIVEDNPGDVDLTRRSIAAWTTPVEIFVVPDGDAALQFLHGEGDPPPPRPDLILLDLNLPRRNGREVLAEVKSDPELRRIPVVVWTSSDAAADVQATYDLHANCYLTKPADIARFRRVVLAIERFWFQVATLPG